MLQTGTGLDDYEELGCLAVRTLLYTSKRKPMPRLGFFFFLLFLKCYSWVLKFSSLLTHLTEFSM